MEFYVDHWDIKKINEIYDYFPIDGFTTNPNIFSQIDCDPQKLIMKYIDFAEKNDVKVFFQVTAPKAEDMVSQAKKFHSCFNHHLVMKIPAVKEGYKALKYCKEEGIVTCMTVIHSMPQALIAAKAGASYVAPYVTHIDNTGANSIQMINDMINAFAAYSYPCKVLGASFRTVNQIEQLAAIGCHAVTITPDMFNLLIAHPSTNESMEKFSNVWNRKFNEADIDSFLPVS